MSNFRLSLYAALFFSLTIANLIGSAFYYNLNERQIKSDLKGSFEKSKTIIYEYVRGYVRGLEGARGVFVVTNNHLDREGFKKYALSRHNFREFPGVLGFGFVRRVPHEKLATYVKQMQKQFPDYTVKTIGAMKPGVSDHFLIEMVEPFDENKNILGLDISSEKRRREAAQTAQKTGEPTLSHRLDLIQKLNMSTGFLYLLPVYETYETPATESERVARTIGWVYTPIVLDKLIARIADKIDNRFHTSLFELNEAGEPEKLYSDQSEPWPDQQVSSVFKFQSDFELGGKKWLLKAEPNFDVMASHQIYSVLLFVFSEVAISLLIYILWKMNKLRHSAEQLAAERYEKLKQKESEVLGIINYIPLMISYWLPDLKNVYANQKFSEMFGYSPEMIQGHSMKEIMGDLLFDEELPWVEKVKEGNVQSYEKQIAISGLADRYILTTLTPHFDEKKLIGFFILKTDISEIKNSQKEKELLQSRLIDAAKMAALGEMSSGIAHEVNNPLTIIIGKAELLLRKRQNFLENADNFFQELNVVKQTAQRIAVIVRGLKAFSRQADQDPVQDEFLLKIINETLDLCAQKFKLAQMEVKLNVQPDLKIQCRPVQISQVLMNLLNNSLDATAGQKMRWIEIQAVVVGYEVCIFFKDSGKGIAPEVVEKIFQPFFTTKEVGQGTGLGLSISKGIIESHGGSLSYFPIEGVTCFKMTLPQSL